MRPNLATRHPAHTPAKDLDGGGRCSQNLGMGMGETSAGDQPLLAGPPEEGVRVPRAVTDLAGGQAAVPVWRNELGGLTFRLGTDRFVKWVAHGTPVLDLGAEAERLAWAGLFVPVPRVLDAGSDDDGAWLVTAALPGTSAVAWTHDPRTAAIALGVGLRRLHEALPVASCPFSWAAEDRLDRARRRLAEGHGPSSWFAEHRHLSASAALAALADPPPVQRPVVCHGDPCVPNTLLAADGTFTGVVDLGSLGVADPWADLAVAAWSTEWNFGPGVAREVYAAYGVAPDEERIAYYRLLWDLT